MSDTDTTTATLTVTFDRIGRTHNPPPFQIPALLNGDRKAEAILRHASRYLSSRYPDVVILDDGTVQIFCGFSNGGTGRITPWPVEDADIARATAQAKGADQ